MVSRKLVDTHRPTGAYAQLLQEATGLYELDKLCASSRTLFRHSPLKTPQTSKTIFSSTSFLAWCPKDSISFKLQDSSPFCPFYCFVFFQPNVARLRITTIAVYTSPHCL
ncbi:hypothetical protein AFLA_010222 [Aspergillus flavus NRRL3357]|nr:hypothetical protein AFLA_010222 [Aspergillus flavus NRRL3357]